MWTRRNRGRFGWGALPGPSYGEGFTGFILLFRTFKTRTLAGEDFASGLPGSISPASASVLWLGSSGHAPKAVLERLEHFRTSRAQHSESLVFIKLLLPVPSTRQLLSLAATRSHVFTNTVNRHQRSEESHLSRCGDNVKASGNDGVIPGHASSTLKRTHLDSYRKKSTIRSKKDTASNAIKNNEQAPDLPFPLHFQSSRPINSPHKHPAGLRGQAQRFRDFVRTVILRVGR